MKAVYYKNFQGLVEVREIPNPTVSKDSVIVKVGSEIQIFKVGDRATVPFVSGCGSCPECNSVNYQNCDDQFQPGYIA
ncbi:MAG: alcohol dehydrogenase catalytic domain-containing protein [Methylococcales bacterium]